jgi:hypothetical protein
MPHHVHVYAESALLQDTLTIGVSDKVRHTLILWRVEWIRAAAVLLVVRRPPLPAAKLRGAGVCVSVHAAPPNSPEGVALLGGEGTR